MHKAQCTQTCVLIMYMYMNVHANAMIIQCLSEVCGAMGSAEKGGGAGCPGGFSRAQVVRGRCGVGDLGQLHECLMSSKNPQNWWTIGLWVRTNYTPKDGSSEHPCSRTSNWS